mmetsp:Transcript_76392/g.205532  ORF Transcript_76392/g.205532 Transcript_76392/m.205532 type:complete len:340 (+) Transcript_76392:13410-14429(+)
MGSDWIGPVSLTLWGAVANDSLAFVLEDAGLPGVTVEALDRNTIFGYDESGHYASYVFRGFYPAPVNPCAGIPYDQALHDSFCQVQLLVFVCNVFISTHPTKPLSALFKQRLLVFFLHVQIGPENAAQSALLAGLLASCAWSNLYCFSPFAVEIMIIILNRGLPTIAQNQYNNLVILPSTNISTLEADCAQFDGCCLVPASVSRATTGCLSCPACHITKEHPNGVWPCSATTGSNSSATNSSNRRKGGTGGGGGGGGNSGPTCNSDSNVNVWCSCSSEPNTSTSFGLNSLWAALGGFLFLGTISHFYFNAADARLDRRRRERSAAYAAAQVELGFLAEE